MPNDGQIAPDTQNDACKTNPLAEDCQNHAKSTQFIGQQTGFLSVGSPDSGEDIGNQGDEVRVAPPAPQTPPLPAPITSVNSYDFVPKTSSSTQSAPAEQRSGSAVSGQSHPVDNAITVADWVDSFTSPALSTTRDTSIDDKGIP